MHSVFFFVYRSDIHGQSCYCMRGGWQRFGIDAKYMNRGALALGIIFSLAYTMTSKYTRVKFSQLHSLCRFAWALCPWYHSSNSQRRVETKSLARKSSACILKIFICKCTGWLCICVNPSLTCKYFVYLTEETPGSEIAMPSRNNQTRCYIISQDACLKKKNV